MSATQLAFLALKVEEVEAKRAGDRQEASRAKPGEQVGKATPKLGEPKEKGEAAKIAAKAVGANHSYVSDAKRLAEKAPDVAEAAKAGKISMTTAKAVAALPKNAKKVSSDMSNGQNLAITQSVSKRGRKGEGRPKEFAAETAICHTCLATP